MATIESYIRRYPVASFFALTFAISWGGVLLVVGGEIPATPERAEILFPSVFLAMLAGPTIAGIAMTWLIDGPKGLRDVLSRLLKLRVHPRWYARAILIAPLVLFVLPIGLSLFFHEVLPGVFETNDTATLLMFGLTVGLGAGIFEELGWTGFAIPKLRSRYGMLATGLIVGFLWGLWHFLVTFWGTGNPHGGLSWDLLVPSLLSAVAVLPAFRVLMVWVHDRTKSLFVVMMMHASLTASTLILQPLATGGPLLIYTVVVAAAMWGLVATVALTRKYSRQPLRRRIA